MSTCVMCTDGTPRVAETPALAAMPTLGCFVPGYLLVVPRTHALSFGQLDAVTLAEAEGLIAALSARLSAVYDLPVLAFEYGLAAPGMRPDRTRLLAPDPHDGRPDRLAGLPAVRTPGRLTRRAAGR